MASLNRVSLIGNLGHDPELRHTSGKIPVLTLNIATNELRGGREGNREEATEWHRVVVWDKQAENCARYLSKGKPVYVDGKLRTRSYADKATGEKRYVTEIIASNVQFLGSPGHRDDAHAPTGQSQPDGDFARAPDDEDVPF